MSMGKIVRKALEWPLDIKKKNKNKKQLCVSVSVASIIMIFHS